MKKLLLLGAMQMHIPLIKRAKEMGIYVITCDYIPENEGHKYSDECYFDSTTDLNAVYNIAKNCNIDGIMTFNSDPAALSAAYISEQLGLFGSGYNAVKIMSEKDLFRKFLSENGFNTPKYSQYKDLNSVIKDLNGNKYEFPIIMKPVDSSGSKGVVKIDNKNNIAEHFENAMRFSRCKRIIIEEYIEAKGAQLHGDAFVFDNKIEFIYLGDHHFNSSINNLVPVSTTFPSMHRNEDIERVEREVQKFISKVGFKQGGINIEARISNKDNKIYLIEVGPRNGGNFTPIIIQYASGFSFIDSCLDVSLGNKPSKQKTNKNGFYAYMIIYSKKDGILQSVKISPNLKNKIIDKYEYIPIGNSVKSFKSANAAIGVLLVKFTSIEEMTEYVDNIDKYCKVTVI